MLFKFEALGYYYGDLIYSINPRLATKLIEVESTDVENAQRLAEELAFDLEEDWYIATSNKMVSGHLITNKIVHYRG